MSSSDSKRDPFKEIINFSNKKKSQWYLILARKCCASHRTVMVRNPLVGLNICSLSILPRPTGALYSHNVFSTSAAGRIITPHCHNAFINSSHLEEEKF
jgi:hypothetical protein